METEMRRIKSWLFRIFLPVVGSLLVFLVAGCSDLVPSKYKHQEFTADSLDLRAAALLSTNVTDSVGRYIPGVSRLINSRTLFSIVDTVMQDSLEQIELRTGDQATAENEVIALTFNSVADSLQNQLMVRDSLMTVDYPSNAGISYALFKVSAADVNDVYVFESMQFNQDTSSQHIYNQNNLNEYARIDFFQSGGSFVSSTEDMPNEVVSSSSEIVPLPGSDYVVPTIRARYKIHLAAGTYIVRFTVSSPGTVNLFKVLILSI